MSIFEALMLICFGAAWPVSIIKSVVSKRTAGKSFWFMLIVFCGYIAGITNKLVYDKGDPVVFLYFLNAAMILTDIILFLRNKRYEKDTLANEN